jgi:hypothetical protein
MAAAGVGFALNVVGLVWPARRGQPWVHGVLVGAAGFAVAAVLDGALALQLFLRTERLYPPDSAQALWTVALYGALVPFVLGVAERMLPGMVGAKPPSPRALSVARALLLVGVPLQALGSVASFESVWRLPLSLSGRAAIGLGLFVAAVAFHTFPRGRRPPREDPAIHWSLVAAFGALGLSGLARTALAGAEALGAPPQHLLLDAERHLLTIGFLVALAVAVALRLVPGLARVPLRHPRLARWALGLLWLSVLLRTGEALAVFGLPSMLRVAAHSGNVSWVALVLFGFVLVATLKGRRTSTPGLEAQPRGIHPAQSLDARR